ncbi:NAD-dependent epimerase/dehydratase family protein [Nitrospira defluvii]|uniref:NAD-dependent epimerase/dehydratase n=1 Tax=Nitrospira defluvii TaxID=330214 RepID=A0ABN7LUU8_9BACT|nr:NAD-dependent epimerase/dehydratase family protein [Nitrospira defluvii]CAE6766972.1 NAD-dependent epimerase/dehydratase [Nitrospira defluvii]
MYWKNKRVLITGGAGQIGSHLVARLAAEGAQVTVADNLWRGKKSNLLAEDGVPVIDLEHRFLELDLADYRNCERATEGQDVVYHLADVVAGINYVFGNQFSLFNANLIIDSNMLRAAIANHASSYVYVGTACSYPAERQSKLNPPPFKEDDVYPASPESSYGWSKLMGEMGCDLARKEKLLDIGILRFHNVYGPHCEMSPEKSQVIPSLIRKAIRYPDEEFVVWGSGKQRRAFVFVSDIVDALVSVATKGMNRGVIQIGPDYSTSIKEIAERVCAISGKQIDIRFDTSKPEGDVDRAADWTRARTLLDWSPKTSIQEGLEQTYAWCERQILQGVGRG